MQHARQGRTADRRRHRKRSRHLARRRQGRQLEAPHRRRVRHPRHHAIRHRRPEDQDRRHRRFRAVGAAARRPTCRSVSPNSPSRRRSRNPGSGARGHFPGPLFLAVAPIEIEWPQREALAKASGANEAVSYDDLLRAAASGRFRSYHRALPVRLGRRGAGGDLRHRRLADFAVDRLRVGRERDPARPRGDPARRDRCGAVRRDRRLGQCRKA